MIKFRCVHCEQKLGVPDEYAGRRVRCTKCSQPSTVPVPVANVPIAEIAQPSEAAKKSVHSTASAQTGTTFPSETSSISQQPVHPSAGSYDVVKRQPKQRPQTEDDVLDELEEIEDDPRQEAIRLARQERLRRGRSESKETKSSRVKKDKSGGLTLFDMIPDFLRLPLGLLLGIAAGGLTIWIWVLSARASESALCFTALFVPIAIAIGMRIVAVERDFLLGLLCLMLGAAGIVGGKAVIAKYVVVPFFHKTATEECLVNLPETLADEKFQFPAKQSIKGVANDGDFLMCAALVSLVEDGVADPAKSRSWAVHILEHSNKLSMIDFFDALTSGGTETVPIPNLTVEDEEVMASAWGRIGEWLDTETNLQMMQKYYPAVSKMAQQAKYLKMLADSKLTYKMAVLNTFGLFDLIWIFMGLSMGYAMTAFD